MLNTLSALVSVAVTGELTHLGSYLMNTAACRGRSLSFHSPVQPPV